MLNKTCTMAVKMYEVDNEWRVEVIRKEDGLREAWIYHKDYGVKHLMFGVRAKGQELLDMIEANLLEHIKIYKDLYICEC